MLTEQSKKASVWHSMSVPNLLSLIPPHELPLPAPTSEKLTIPRRNQGLQDWAFAHAGPTQKAHPVLLSL